MAKISVLDDSVWAFFEILLDQSPPDIVREPQLIWLVLYEQLVGEHIYEHVVSIRVYKDVKAMAL